MPTLEIGGVPRLSRLSFTVDAKTQAWVDRSAKAGNCKPEDIARAAIAFAMKHAEPVAKGQSELTDQAGSSTP